VTSLLAATIFVMLVARHFEKVSFALSDRPCMTKIHTAAIQNEVSHACLLLNDAGVTYWLHRGTLLGAMREGGVLQHDTDADIGYDVQDIDKTLKALGSRFGHRGVVPHTDLGRFDVDPSSNTIRVALADHENDIVNRVNAMRVQMQLDWVLPTKPLGGSSALSHCMVPAQPHKVYRRNMHSIWATVVLAILTLPALACSLMASYLSTETRTLKLSARQMPKRACKITQLAALFRRFIMHSNNTRIHSGSRVVLRVVVARDG
jgi:hypothetical protein